MNRDVPMASKGLSTIYQHCNERSHQIPHSIFMIELPKGWTLHNKVIVDLHAPSLTRPLRTLRFHRRFPNWQQRVRGWESQRSDRECTVKENCAEFTVCLDRPKLLDALDKWSKLRELKSRWVRRRRKVLVAASVPIDVTIWIVLLAHRVFTSTATIIWDVVAHSTVIPPMRGTSGQVSTSATQRRGVMLARVRMKRHTSCQDWSYEVHNIGVPELDPAPVIQWAALWYPVNLQSSATNTCKVWYVNLFLSMLTRIMALDDGDHTIRKIGGDWYDRQLWPDISGWHRVIFPNI